MHLCSERGESKKEKYAIISLTLIILSILGGDCTSFLKGKHKRVKNVSKRHKQFI